MSWADKITTTLFGRRFGLQSASSNITGSGRAGNAPDFILGPEDIRVGVTTAETTATNLAAYGVSYLTNTSAGSSQVFNSVGAAQNAGHGFVGELHGLPVYTDAMIPTTVSSSTITGATEDAIIVARKSDLLLWENGEAPRQFRFDEVGSGTNTIRLSVLGESAFTAGWYPKGVAAITGSGLGAPTYP